MNPDRISCPRCGESVPADLEVCDACGQDLSRTTFAAGAVSQGQGAPRVGERGRAGKRQGATTARDSEGVPGVAWLLLVVGLVVGGMVGYALHTAVGPRAESGMPTGPSDVMAGAQGSGGGMAGDGAGIAQGDGGTTQGDGGPRMPPQIVQMVQAYKAALAKNPNDLDANIGLGNLEFDSGQWLKAIDYYSRALAIDPKKVDVRVDRAIAYHATGDNDTARKELLRATREKPDHKNAWLNLGVVNRELGNRAEAVRAWERYLELDPNGEHAATIRQEMETLKQSG
jgi:hypothetical protein